MQFNKLLTLFTLTAILLVGALQAEQPTLLSDNLPESIHGFIKGLNTQSYGEAKPFISKDFGIPGVPEEYMKQAFQQMFDSFPVEIEKYLYKKQKPGNQGPVYTVSIMAGNRITDVDFGIDKEGKVLSCSMFRAQSPENMVSTDNLKLVTYAEADFELVEGIIILPVELNGEQVKFILDTGAPMLVINSAADTVSTDVVIAGGRGIGGDIDNMGFTHVSEFKWAGGSNKYFDTISMDLSHLEAELGMKFKGLISKAEIEPYETYIDYANRKIRFYQLKENGNLLESEKLTKASRQISFDLNRHIACLKASVGREKVQLGLDTGAQTNLLDDNYYDVFLKDMTDVQSDTLSGADTNSAVISTGIIKSTKIGKSDFSDMRYAFSDLDTMNKAYSLDIKGLLGYPFLSKQPISLNYRKKKLSLY